MRALALASLLLVAGCDVLDPMMVQDKQKPYRESDLVPTGLSMLAPPPGAVSRERVLGPALATGRNPDGTPLGRIPVPVTRELLEQGRKRFDITCATCHGTRVLPVRSRLPLAHLVPRSSENYQQSDVRGTEAGSPIPACIAWWKELRTS